MCCPPARPFVKFQEKSINLVDGMRLELKCLVEGWPTPEVTWYKKDVLLNSSLDLRITSHPPAMNERFARLSINGTSQVDRGEYWCVATNGVHGVGLQLSGRASVTVRVKSKLSIILFTISLFFALLKTKSC